MKYLLFGSLIVYGLGLIFGTSSLSVRLENNQVYINNTPVNLSTLDKITEDKDGKCAFYRLKDDDKNVTIVQCNNNTVSLITSGKMTEADRQMIREMEKKMKEDALKIAEAAVKMRTKIEAEIESKIAETHNRIMEMNRQMKERMSSIFDMTRWI